MFVTPGSETGCDVWFKDGGTDKRQEEQLKLAEMLKFLLRVIRMDRIRKEYFRQLRLMGLQS